MGQQSLDDLASKLTKEVSAVTAMLETTESSLTGLTKKVNAINDHLDFQGIRLGKIMTGEASVPTKEELEALRSEVSELIRMNDTATKKELEELQSKCARIAPIDFAAIESFIDIHQIQMEGIKTDLHAKADKASVPSFDDFDDKGMLRKAERIEVPTLQVIPAMVQASVEVLEAKLLNEVASVKTALVEHQAMIVGATEALSQKAEKENLHDLASKLNSKADQDMLQVLSDILANVTSTELSSINDQLTRLRAIAESLSSRIDAKADTEWAQSSIKGLVDRMQYDTGTHSFISNQQLSNGKEQLQRKTEKDDVVSKINFMLQEVQAGISEAQAKILPDLAIVLLRHKEDLKAIEELSARLESKADLKRTQDALASISDTLLPAARAVHVLPASKIIALAECG